MELRMIEQLESKASDHLGNATGARARGRASEAHAGKLIEVVARRTHKGSPAFGYRYGGVGLERHTLLLLICPETACAVSQTSQRNWRQFQGIAQIAPRPATGKLKVARLFDEVALEDGRTACAARPASFVCLTPCPVHAHAPALMRKTGWDLFSQGKCIAGGLQWQPGTAALAPMFETTAMAQIWLQANQSAL